MTGKTDNEFINGKNTEKEIFFELLEKNSSKLSDAEKLKIFKILLF